MTRFVQTQRSQYSADRSEDIETLFEEAGYEVEVKRLSSKRYHVTFLGNPWEHTCDDYIQDDVDREMERNLSKWMHWTITDDYAVVPDSWLLTAP